MQLGWIDFSREDKAKALDILRLLQEETAIDELGFGVIRDAFANRFFPGTSTVQTRAKYFLIIPYMLKDALSGKMGTDEQTVYRKFHILERECARKLLGNGATEGVIGRNSLPRGRWVVRAPSDIYWTGLRLYKIVKSGRPLRDLLNLYCRILGQDESSSGDDPFTDDTEDTCALDVVGVYEDDWFENLDIDLTRKEAIFLREKILSSDGESLLKLALKKNIPLRSYPDFAAFAASIQGSVSPRMKNLVRLAVEFNEVVFAARVRFGLILSDFRDADLKDEWQHIRRSGIASFDIDALFSSLHEEIGGHSALMKFMRDFCASVSSRDASPLDDIVSKREVQLKGKNRAKLQNRAKYYHEGHVGASRFDYRLGNAGRILDDIYSAEGLDV